MRGPDMTWIDRWGLVAGTIGAWASLGPSLIPRRWWMTALTVGFSQISGYFSGRALHLLAIAARSGFDWALRRPSRRAPGRRRRSPRRDRLELLAAAVVGITAGAGTVAAMRVSLPRQAEIAELVRARIPAVREQLIGLAAANGATSFALLLEWARVLTTRRIRHRLHRVLPGAVSAILGAAGPLLALWLVSDRVVRDVLWRQLLDAASTSNDSELPGLSRPTSPLRSGSPQSTESWRGLGRYGRAFVASGPRAADIARATGSEALEPIRVFAGVRSWRSVTGAARAVAGELRRTGAFERSAIVLVTTTGTGWTSDWSAAAVEHLTGGDVATAGMQYTTLASGPAFLSHPRLAARAAAALRKAVEAELEQSAPARRPRLFVTGESLGAHGVLGSFASLDELLQRTDGGVIAGAPRISRHWERLVAGRDAGSPETAPVIERGRRIRFATRPAELDADWQGRPFEPWQAPRLAMLQHASDPIVWWSPQLLLRRPDWLRERVGRDVTPHMRWFPIVTFWQLATDMPASVSVPGGYAHRYFEEYVPAWASVLGVPLDAHDEARIVAGIRRRLPQR